MKKTHDGRNVFTHDEKLPKHAIGWTKCALLDGAYSTWLAPEDCARAKADLARITRVIIGIRTMYRAHRVCERLAIIPTGKFRDLKTIIIATLHADRWPLHDSE